MDLNNGAKVSNSLLLFRINKNKYSDFCHMDAEFNIDINAMLFIKAFFINIFA